ncbi:hypothetical protein QBC32DRAFT_313040 [Pseudoneurospora amorphoporcata]|uniref:Uncharacterized protein n=1 Tax=Pseudoneurospora amorphoporcata TaxID=241081 RepID=A0AAN6NWW4_9PEZI|nr:hypothetical protein QBC32DRAFT_313040 [Pseudoneurospora amorphoporcata]
MEMLDKHTLELIDLSRYDTHGFLQCSGYTLRRHKAETLLANAGCYEARQDWIQYLGG